MKKFLPLSVALVALLLLATCERDWNNPFDPNNTLDPEAWAPQNLQIETTSITERRLTWTYNGPATIQGFKIDRKKGDEAWQVALAAPPKETRTWNDTTLIPQAGLTYQYRIYTYAGNNSSAQKATTTPADFPAPSELTITKLSDISYKLEWKDNSTGEQGFKIDRKAIDNEWVIGYGKVGANEIAFVDTNVFVGKSSFNLEYRVYAFHNETESAKIDANTIAALTPPTYLQLEKLTDISYKLTWMDNSTGEQGFKIDRKTGDENWAIAFATVAADATSFVDTNVFLNKSGLPIWYRVYGFIGNYVSEKVEATVNAAISSPENLLITVNTQSSVSLTWIYNGAGHQGFKIDRKTNEGAWQNEFAILTSTQNGYTDNIVSLEENTYMYRVYAFILNNVSEKVEKYISKPTVTTAPVINITANTATGGGNVTNDGGFPVTARGVCWSTSPYPTTANQKTIDGSGTGSFTSYITGLSEGLTYYLRAYANNAAGTGYGTQISFQNNSNNSLVINELFSRGTVENPDWVEVYNATGNPLDLTGYKIFDSGGQAGTKPKKEFPVGTIIPAGGWYVIVVDDDDPNGSGFGLGSGGEKVWLENVEGAVIDSIEFPALEESQSFGRYPDGAENWQILYVVTKGAANDNSGPPPVVTILMNEVFSRGIVEDPDWIEVYNTTGSELDLTGFKIYDSGGNAGTKPKKEFPAGTIIPANGFVVIVVDDDTETGFGFSSGGEEIWLEDPNGNVIDNFDFPAMTETSYSYGRKPDGSSNFYVFTEITKGGSNNNAGTLPKGIR